PRNVPERWLSAFSITGTETPIRCMPLAHVRRRSCKRHVSAATPALALILRLTASQSFTGFLPSIVNTKSQPANRGRSLIRSQVCELSGIVCSHAFLGRPAGGLHI